MKKLLFMSAIILMNSCSEKLIEKPDDLIAKEQMVDILSDLAIMNAVKNANIAILRDNKLDPTAYVFEKYGIDSVRFVESDRYYSSIPDEYEALYMAVETKLQKEKSVLEEAKKLKDSLNNMEVKSKNEIKRPSLKEFKDSLQ